MELNSRRFVKKRKVSIGIPPSKTFSLKFKDSRLVKYPISFGIVPTMPTDTLCGGDDKELSSKEGAQIL